MNIIELIEKKKQSLALSKDEIESFVQSSITGDIKDYQITALLMAISLNGMNEEETFCLTQAMKNSGDFIDFRTQDSIIVDKHSTGGVGDVTTLVVMPTVAALGFKVAKLSGKSLGFTGGTLDKLESFESINLALSPEQITKQVNQIGIAISGQTGSIAPADKLFYALRDVSATVDSIPLIASSIMSKKLAFGTDVIVLDTKVGDGSLLGSLQKTKELATLMVKMGKMANRKISALLTSMDEPLCDYIGNALEVKGALDALEGIKSPLYSVSVALATEILMLSNRYDLSTAKVAVERVLQNGEAKVKFEEMLKAQGVKSLELKKAKHYAVPIYSTEDGYISKIETKQLGSLVGQMGGGRQKVDDEIDHSVGLKIEKRIGDKVNIGEPICLAYANTLEQLKIASKAVDMFHFSSSVQKPIQYIVDVVR